MEDMKPDVVTRFEREIWSRCAPSYLETFAALTSQTVPLLINAANIGGGTRVLDIGSGPGNAAKELAAVGADVDGVDFSEEMIEVARQRYPEIRFQQANAEEIPFDAGTFDAVVSNFVVHHLARPTRVFQEVHRVLERGGRFAFVVWGPPEEQSSIGAFFAAVEAHHDLAELPQGPLFGVTDRATYEPLIAGAGLQDLQLETHDVVWRSKTLDPILRGFWDLGDMAALPPDVQARIEASTRENAKPYKKDGQYEFPHSVLLGHATSP
jgi:SAM-dependent methyltransferase